MSGTREKLIELLDDIQRDGNDFADVEMHGVRIPDTVSNDDIADHLIANGVTVRQWIPVTERFPNPVSKHKRFDHEYTKSETVLCVCVQKGGKRMVKEGHCEFYGDTPVWRIPGTIDSVTHWMPLPNPPKEVL
jgi:hypothetical protein